MKRPDVDRPTALAAAIWLGIVGASVLLILPVFVGSLVDDRGLSDQAAGWIGSADLIGYALASYAAFKTIRRIDWTRLVYAGLVLILTGNLFSAILVDFWPVFVVRMLLSGFGSGLLITVAYTLLGDTRNPERSTGIYWSFNVLGGAAGLAVFPPIIDRWGSAGMFVALAITAIISLPFVFLWLPRSGRVRDTSARTEGGPTVEHSAGSPAGRASYTTGIFAVLAGIALFNFGLGGVWAFVERIGVEAGIAVLTVGTILSATYLVSTLGSAAASWQGARFGYLGPYAVGIVIMAASLGILLEGSGIALFILALCLMNFAWNYCLTYQFSAVFANDASGRMSVFIILVEAVGLMLGPGVAGFLVEHYGYAGAIWMGLTCSAVSLVLFLASKNSHFTGHGG